MTLTEGGLRPLRHLLFLALLSGALCLTILPGHSVAHGGYPLSLGAVEDGRGEVAARLVLVYLREGQGMTVEPLMFQSEQELSEAYRKGKVDLVVHAPGADWVARECPAAVGRQTAPAAREAYFSRLLPDCWSAPFAAAAEEQMCGLSVAAHPRVTGDLRFSLLQQTITRLLSSMDGAAMASLVRDGGNAPRQQVIAARRLLQSKGLI